MVAVTPEQVQALLEADSSSAGPAVDAITAMARAYTRGRGFTDGGGEPNEEIAAVILTASARLASNAQQVSRGRTVGPFMEDFRSYFNGWTLAEQAVLNRYRVRAM